MRRIATLIVILITLFIPKVNALNKSVIDIEDLTLEKTIEYLDKGVITSEELVNLYLDRINTYNSEYNALITINNKIVEEAKQSDNLRNNNQKRGILEGIPIIVKDNIDVYEMPTTGGAKALTDNYPNEDSDVVKKLKNAGAIVIGIPNSFYIGSEKASIKANKITYEPIKNAMKELITKLEINNIKIVYLDDFYGSKEQYYNTTSISGFTMCDGFNEYKKC